MLLISSRKSFKLVLVRVTRSFPTKAIFTFSFFTGCNNYFPLINYILGPASSLASSYNKGNKICFWPSFLKVYVFILLSWINLLSYFHGLTIKTWQTSIGITSHTISSLYFPIWNLTFHCLLNKTRWDFCN